MSKGCWNWSGKKHSSGYGMLYANGKKYYAHRVSYVIHIGDPVDDMHVLHKCDNPVCTNPKHLFLGTHKDNMLDRDRKGRCAKGEGKPKSSKLSNKDVLEIRRLWSSGFKQQAIADAFGVKQPQISDIVNRKKWRHI